MNLGVVALYMTVGISTNILQVLCSDCYYTRLGVKRDATPGQIKQAFRRQAKIYHPDRNKDKKAAENKFIELTKAYEVLSDENKRRQYDAMGHANYERNMADGDQGGAHSNFHHFSFDEVFKRFFPEESGDGGHGGHGGHGGFHFSFGDDMFGQANDGMHHKFHQQMHEQAHQAGPFGSFDSFFGDFGNPQFAGEGGFFHHEASESHGGQRCKTVTKTVGSMTTTYTECS